MTAQPEYGTMASLWRRYDNMPRQLAFQAQTIEEWKTWRELLHARLVALLGGFPLESPPLQPQVVDTAVTPDYLLEKVAFQSEPDVYVPCYVLTPRHVKPPYRVVVSLHGHGTGGAAHTIGRVVSEETRTAEEAFIRSFNYDYSHQLAQRGFMVVVPEQRGFGERMEKLPDMIQMIGGDPLWKCSCRAESFNAMLLGKTLVGLRVWDVMRTIDYIASRPEPKVPKLACLGLSGGGTTTLYAAALDPRIDVAVISGYFNTFRSSIMPIWHCECNYVPGILQYAEMYDIAGLIAPRPLLIESGTEDILFPVSATEAAFEKVRQVYGLLGVPEQVDKDIYPGGHQFSGRKAFDWLARWMTE